MRVLMTRNYDEFKFGYWLLGHDSPNAASRDAKIYDRQGVLELLYFHGTEKDPDFQYPVNDENVNKLYGYLCFSVDNLEAACSRIASAGYEILQDSPGKYAIALDPDGYQVKLIEQTETNKKHTSQTDPSKYRLV